MKFTTRFGSKVQVDEAFEAWTSGDVSRMLRATHLVTNGVDRHFLLQSIVGELYRRRVEIPSSLPVLKKYAAVHLAEMGGLLAELKRDALSRPTTAAVAADDEYIHPQVTTFDSLCMVLCEEGDYDGARAVWRRAVEVGYIEADGLEYHDQLIEKRRKRFAKRAQQSPK